MNAFLILGRIGVRFEIVIICVDGGISKDKASKSDGWSFRCHSCMVLYLGEVGLKFWEVRGDGKALKGRPFDVTTCRFFWYYLR